MKRTMSVALNPAALLGILCKKMPSKVWICEAGRHFRSLSFHVDAGVAVVGVDPMGWTPDLGNVVSTADEVVLAFASDHFGDAEARAIQTTLTCRSVVRVRPQA